jgi:hypothetical protein
MKDQSQLVTNSRKACTAAGLSGLTLIFFVAFFFFFLKSGFQNNGRMIRAGDWSEDFRRLEQITTVSKNEV